MEEKPDASVDDVTNALKRGRMMWHVMLSLPIVYLLLCVLIREVWFDNGRQGFLSAVRPSVERIILIGLAALAGGMQILLLGLGKYFKNRMHRASNAEFIDLFWKRLFYQGMVCDTVSFLGLLHYILFGDLRVMFAFGTFSYLLYAQMRLGVCNPTRNGKDG